MKLPVIICIDDEPIILNSLKIELEQCLGDHYLIQITDGGEEALELISELIADNYEIVLIIADYIMPYMRGDELLKQIHKILPKTIKIMLTGHADVQGIANAINSANLYRYISKPWQVDDLNLTIKEALSSYFNQKKLAEKTIKLEKLNSKQKKLIKQLKSSENNLKDSTEELARINKALLRFVPQQFLDLLNKNSIIDVNLGDQVSLEMSILFCDIRNFTSLSETISPQENFNFINSYLSYMEAPIIENNGFIDKYIGDAIMALFSCDPDHAIKAGISMLNRLKEYNQYRKKSGYLPIKNGIGINTGELMLGIIGGKNRIDTTVISDTVNLASRIENLTKNYGVSLLISDYTFSKLKNSNNYNIRIIDRVKVKGKLKPVSVYEVFDADTEEMKELKLTTKTTFEQAVISYNLGSFNEAEKNFISCWEKNQNDVVVEKYLKKLKKSDFSKKSDFYTS